MNDDNVTLGEVFRAVQAVDARLMKSVEDREKAEHTFRNKFEAINLRVAVIDTRLTSFDTRLGALESLPNAAKASDTTARWTGITAGLAAVGALIWNWLHK